MLYPVGILGGVARFDRRSAGEPVERAQRLRPAQLRHVRGGGAGGGGPWGHGAGWWNTWLNRRGRRNTGRAAPAGGLYYYKPGLISRQSCTNSSEMNCSGCTTTNTVKHIFHIAANGRVYVRRIMWPVAFSGEDRPV